MSMYTQFDVQQQGDVAVLQLAEPRDSDCQIVRRLHDELMQLVETVHPRGLVVNFADVERYPTEAVSCLISAKRRLGPPRTLKCCGMNDRVERAYRFLNLAGTLFDVHESAEEAVAAI